MKKKEWKKESRAWEAIANQVGELLAKQTYENYELNLLVELQNKLNADQNNLIKGLREELQELAVD